MFAVRWDLRQPGCARGAQSRRSGCVSYPIFTQCCGSGMFIPDPGSDFFPSRIRTVSIPDPGSASKDLSILTPEKPKKWFLSSRKYDPGCSSRIRMLTFYPSRIPDPGVKKAPDPGSRIRIRKTVPWYSLNPDLGTVFCWIRSGSRPRFVWQKLKK